MASNRAGTAYVGWELRLPARFWGLEYSKKEYGDQWQTTEWKLKVKAHRPKGKKWSEEWYFDWEADGEVGEFAFNSRWKNIFLKEDRPTGVFSVLHCCCVVVCVSISCVCTS